MAGSSAPIVDRIRIIPRAADFLDRNVGASGEVFFSRDTNSIRVYSGTVAGGYELAKTDLSNISNSDFATKATAAGIGGSSPEWNDTQNKPTFALVSTSGDYEDLSNKPTIPVLDDYATITYVDNAVANATFGGGEGGSLTLTVAADDSTVHVISPGETFQIVGGTGITTASDAEGKITITATSPGTTFSGLTDTSTASLTIDKIYEPAITMLRVDNSGVSAFTFAPHYAGNNPTIYAISGTTIAFDLSGIGGHKFEIQDNTLTAFDTGLVHVETDGTISEGSAAQGKGSGTLYWRIPESEGGTFVYVCQDHPAMFGTITVKRLSLL